MQCLIAAAPEVPKLVGEPDGLMLFVCLHQLPGCCVWVYHLSAHVAHKPSLLACRPSPAATQVPAIARQEFLCRTWLSSRTWSSWWSASRTWTPACRRWRWKPCPRRSGQAGGCCAHLIIRRLQGAQSHSCTEQLLELASLVPYWLHCQGSPLHCARAGQRVLQAWQATAGICLLHEASEVPPARQPCLQAVVPA